MKFIEINAASYAVEIFQHHKRLPFLLMLHGFLGDRRVFRHIMDDLCEVCNPVTVDLLGHGESEKLYEPSRYDETRQIADILELVKKLWLSSLFIYGYSMGGRLALKTALHAPELFEGLILESATYGIGQKQQRAERRAADEIKAQRIENDFGTFLSGWKSLELFSSSAEADSELHTFYEEVQQSQDPRAIAASLRGFGTGNMKPVKHQLPAYPGPVLLVAGSEDEKYAEIADTMARLFSSATSRKVKGGHRVHLDNPTELANAIKHFIAQN